MMYGPGIQFNDEKVSILFWCILYIYPSAIFLETMVIEFRTFLAKLYVDIDLTGLCTFFLANPLYLIEEIVVT